MPPQEIKAKDLLVDAGFQVQLNGSGKEPLSVGSRILPSVLEHIGNTPLIRLNKIPQSMGIKCQVLAKCEFYGPGGSHKDRIALQMIEDAEKAGLLRPGGTIIEPTSGNTGIGIALVAAVKGYKCIFTMTDKNSQEKVETLAAMGAKIIKTPGLPYEHPDSYVSVARRLHRETPNSLMLDQYCNPGNPGAHYAHTGVEILNQCNGKLDMLVIGAGTGGAITGLGRRMRDSCPSCIMVGVDPEGSLLAEPQSLNHEYEIKGWEVEGIGHNDFTPANLDKSVVDKWYKSNDKDSLQMARRLIQEEGLLVGGSSGSVMSCALQAIQDANLSEDQKCVIIFPDSIRNYMTKFLTKNWMLEKNLMSDSVLENQNNYKWWNTKVSEIGLEAPLTLPVTATVQTAVDIMKRNNVAQIPVLSTDGSIRGVITVDGVMSKLMGRTVRGSDTIEALISNKFKKVNGETSLAKLAHIIEGGHFALVVSAEGTPAKEVITGVVTQVELLNYIIRTEEESN